jgi:hypothetical protein
MFFNHPAGWPSFRTRRGMKMKKEKKSGFLNFFIEIIPQPFGCSYQGGFRRAFFCVFYVRFRI